MLIVPASALEGGVVVAGGLLPLPVVPPPVETPPVPVAPGALPDPPVHTPVTDGMQAKSAPQSVSTLHGNCHLKIQADVVVWVQVVGGGVGAGSVSHGVFTGHAPARGASTTARRDRFGVANHALRAVPVDHARRGLAGHFSGAGRHRRRTISPLGTAGRSWGAADAWQVVPCGQSVLDTQTWARATAGIARTPRTAKTAKNPTPHTTPKKHDGGTILGGTGGLRFYRVGFGISLFELTTTRGPPFLGGQGLNYRFRPGPHRGGRKNPNSRPPRRAPTPPPQQHPGVSGCMARP